MVITSVSSRTVSPTSRGCKWGHLVFDIKRLEPRELPWQRHYGSTAVKCLSMREKLRGDRIIWFEKPCMWLWRQLRLLNLNLNIIMSAKSWNDITPTLLVSSKRNFLFTSIKFICDDREEEEELVTWTVSMLKYTPVLILLDCFCINFVDQCLSVLQ